MSSFNFGARSISASSEPERTSSVAALAAVQAPLGRNSSASPDVVAVNKGENGKI
jgi:hypothetical protein